MRKTIALALCVSVIGISGFAKAEDFSATFDTYMQELNTRLFEGNSDVSSIRGLIINYCSAIYSLDGFTQNYFSYSAQQSSFAYLICSNIDKVPNEEASKPLTLEEIFKLFTFNELGIQDKRPSALDSKTLTDYCSRSTDLRKCDISTYIPKLLNMLINDYVNMKWPQIYGFDPSSDAKTNANIFSSGYFAGIRVCDLPKYRNTCKQLKKYIEGSQKSLADVEVFDQKKLLGLVNKNVCTVSHKDYSLLLCGLYGDKDTSLQQFVNLAYNEFFYYRLFATYYLTMIQTKTDILKMTQTTIKPEIDRRSSTLLNEVQRSQEAFSLTLRMMRDQYAAFPLHIGFLMYQEDFASLGAPLGKISTPISQLYYTLQNVQKKD